MPHVDRTRLPTVGADPPFTLPRFQRSELDGGTRLWVAPHRRAPVLTLVLLVPAGAAADPPERPGLAALTADLLDEGSTTRSGVELHDALARIGGHLTTEVSSDATVIGLTTLARHARVGIELLLELVIHPRFSSDDVTRVRDLRLNRIGQMRRSPSAVADRVFLESIYRGHPYGHLTIGTEAALSAVTPAQVRDFHETWYLPAFWTLVAVGDVEPDLLREQVAEVWHSPESISRPPDVAVGASPPPADRLVFVHRQDAVQSEIRLGHVGVSRRTPDYYALRVLNAVLGGQFVSRINLNLREDKGYTYGARSSFDWRLGPGPFSVQASVQTGATVAAIREAMREVSEIRGARPSTGPELELARASLTRGFPRGFETASQVARGGVHLALHQLGEDTYEQFAPRIMAVEADDVLDAARRHVRPEDLTAVVVGSRPDVLSGLSSLGLGDPIERQT